MRSAGVWAMSDRRAQLLIRVSAVVAAVAIGELSTSHSAIGQTASTGVRIDRVQPGDQRLSCVELRHEMDRMEQIGAAASGEAAGVKDDVATNSAVGLGTSLAGVPLLGSLVEMGLVQRSFGRNDAAQRADDARQRKAYLAELYNAKGC